ncbi:MAG TPA: lysophospholipid acyltransferase family protein [Solirubrobacteraceae bacterium]|nr:lysophospholipid acyltransferase family protein [Solirubrobacteraceae bacterium]
MNEPRAGVRLYRLLVLLGVPLRWWCRLEVRGREVLPPPGTGVVVVPNHDSMLDPLAIGDTLMRAGRPLRFLAMDTLWRWRLMARVLDGIRQIPIRRGASDTAALQAAVDALADGEAICIFPEGRLSHGQCLRARRGVARIIEASPDAQIVLAAVIGGTDLARFPRRPRVCVELFRPTDATPRMDEDHAALAARLLDEIRQRVPPVAAGRRPARRNDDRASERAGAHAARPDRARTPYGLDVER